MRKLLFIVFIVSFFISPNTLMGQDRCYDVPYVPTPENVVEEMLKIASVNENDILYDLGCGDGRIVISAAKKMGTRGIGVDINPQRIEESNSNAENAEVTDKVKFIEQDLFDVNISEATVVTLYLLPSVNLKLRPKLFRDLKPGTRIVSHDFNMRDWEYDKSKMVNGDSNSHSIYFWIIPANMSGTWEWVMSSGAETKSYVLEIKQEFQKIEGITTAGDASLPLKDAALTGNRLQFTLDQMIKGQIIQMHFDGLVKGNSIEGTVESETGQNPRKSEWKSKRDPSTISNIYE